MVGIGGIGMSALAQLYAHKGARVTGSDRSAQPTTQMLEEKGIAVAIGSHADMVPEDTDLLVYSAAVPSENAERMRARELGMLELNYPEALGQATVGKRLIAVVGTHGKTTTTAMIGKMLEDAGKDPTVVVGSIVPQWQTNFRPGGSDLFVVEACEYRKHFLAFHPEVLVVTNIEWDHTDFYKTEAEFIAAFDEVKAQAGRVIDASVYQATSVPELHLPGSFNQDYARAAKAGVMALCPDIDEAVLDESLRNFKGTWRRFEYKGKTVSGADLYDDYAHHPTSIVKTIQAAREKFLGKQIVVFFHPHLYSRTRDLFDGFVAALKTADQVYVLPVFAAREPHDASVSNEALAEAIRKNGGKAEAVGGMEEVTEKIKSFGAETVVFTMGAGDVYKAGEASLVK